ncbi:MAG: hypothetical protein LBR79_02945 [Oscillospiraceae bacterium]|nr:hypothetical protein [Oscillospiraceae bacterium]
MWVKLIDNIFHPRLRRGEKEKVPIILRHNRFLLYNYQIRNSNYADK